MKKIPLLTGLVVFVSLAGPNAVAQLSTAISPQELNALTALEAINNDLVSIASTLQGQATTPPPTLTPDQVTGTTTGTITATGWNLQFSGRLLGTVVSINQVGSLNGTVRSWTDSGSVGGVGLTGSGGMDGSGKWAARISWGKIIKVIITVVAQVALGAATGPVGDAVGQIVSTLVLDGIPVTTGSSSSFGHYLNSSAEFNGAWAIQANGVLDQPSSFASFQTSLTPAGRIVYTPTGDCFPGGVVIRIPTGLPGPTFPEPPCGYLLILSSPIGLSLTSSVTPISGGNWLTATLSQTSTPASLSLSANAAGLLPGTYTATATISAQQATNGPIAIPVTLIVTPPPSTAVPVTETTQLVSTGTVCNITTTTNSLNPTTGGITGSQTNVASSACSVPNGVYNLSGGQATIAPNQFVVPQVAVNGSWNTEFVISNTTVFAGSFTLNCNQETANNGTQPWTLAFVGGSNSAQTFSVAGGASAFLQTTGVDSAATVQGWCQATVSPGLQVYALFTSGASGIGTAPGSTVGTHFLVPYNNTSSNTTAIALANTTAASETVSVSFRTDRGQIIPGSPLTFPSMGHAAFLLPANFPATAGTQGLAELTSTGNTAMIALQATGSLFSTDQVYPASGQSILIGPFPPLNCPFLPWLPGCPDPPWPLILLDATISINPVHVTITPANGTYTAQISRTNNGVTFSGSFVGGSVTKTNPPTFTFTSVGSGATFNGGALTLTVSPTAFDASKNVVVGTYSGTITLNLPNGSGGTLSGAISGNYTAAIPPPQTGGVAAPALSFSLQSRSPGTGNLAMSVQNAGSVAATNVTITSITGITASGTTDRKSVV